MIVCALDAAPDRYFPPESIKTTFAIKSNTTNTVTLRLEVKSVVGTIKNVRLTARLSGFEQVIPVPSEATFDEIKEGESQYLDFILPTTKEAVNSKLFKIHGVIQYLPDYNAIINYIDTNVDKEYENEVMRDMLKDNMLKCYEQSLKSVETVRYFPPKN